MVGACLHVIASSVHLGGRRPPRCWWSGLHGYLWQGQAPLAVAVWPSSGGIDDEYTGYKALYNPGCVVRCWKAFHHGYDDEAGGMSLIKSDK